MGRGQKLKVEDFVITEALFVSVAASTIAADVEQGFNWMQCIATSVDTVIWR